MSVFKLFLAGGGGGCCCCFAYEHRFDHLLKKDCTFPLYCFCSIFKDYICMILASCLFISIDPYVYSFANTILSPIFFLLLYSTGNPRSCGFSHKL